jgi:hypothetical protein
MLERLDREPLLAGDRKALRCARRVLKRRRQRLGRSADALGDKLHSYGA